MKRPILGLRAVAFAVAIACAAATVARAGGPIYTYDYANRIPYAWNMANWGYGVYVYTDLGTLGILSNDTANGLVANAVAQWSGVPTSSFRAAAVGDFSLISQGDIDASTIGLIIGAWNGGGIDVVYDSDGSIMTDFFGVSPTSVLGISDLDFVAPDSNEILEAWTVLSGPGVPADDPNGTGFAGVVTHEMGHTLNLAHSQANGAALQSPVDPPQPEQCGAPWTGGPTDAQTETMYPFITPEPTGSGFYMATVHLIDDTAALSDLYPADGWPQSAGTISGQITDFAGNPITGVDVIARNVANPFGDCSSYISGQVSKGNAGPDGSFVLNGLTPGASYVLYVDRLMDGSFSVPTPIVLPGPEEYFNGAMESGNGQTDDACQWSPVTVTAGSPVTLTVALNHINGAPILITPPRLDVQTVPTSITPDGGVVVGGEGPQNVPIFRWDLNAGTFEEIGGTLTGSAAISADGQKIAANVVDGDGVNKAAIYANGTWTALPRQRHRQRPGAHVRVRPLGGRLDGGRAVLRRPGLRHPDHPRVQVDGRWRLGGTPEGRLDEPGQPRERRQQRRVRDRRLGRPHGRFAPRRAVEERRCVLDHGEPPAGRRGGGRQRRRQLHRRAEHPLHGQQCLALVPDHRHAQPGGADRGNERPRERGRR